MSSTNEELIRVRVQELGGLLKFDAASFQLDTNNEDFTLRSTRLSVPISRQAP
jgi:hypothetical protein